VICTYNTNVCTFVCILITHTYVLLYLSTECIKLITDNSEIQYANTVTAVTTITHIIANSTVTTTNIVISIGQYTMTSSSASVSTKNQVQTTSSQNSGMYVCTYVCTYVQCMQVLNACENDIHNYVTTCSTYIHG